MDSDLKEYRSNLLKTIDKLNDNYDKLILTLSGGALGLSITFLKDVVKDKSIEMTVYLFVAWCLFVLSLSCVLGSELFGIAANKKAVNQVDLGKIYEELPGGIFSKLTTAMHYLSTVFLIAGLFFIIIFVYINMEVKNVKTNTNPTKSSTKAVSPKSEDRPQQTQLGSSSTSPTKQDDAR